MSDSKIEPLPMDSVLAYLGEIKKTASETEYSRFLEIMKQFKTLSLDTAGVIKEVSELFKNHPNLIDGFQIFLPPAYRSTVQNDEAGDAVSPDSKLPPSVPAADKAAFKNAIDFVQRVKMRFLDNPEQYKLFLHHLHAYQKQEAPVSTVKSNMEELFKDHKDLLQEFQYFLPIEEQTIETIQKTILTKSGEYQLSTDILSVSIRPDPSDSTNTQSTSLNFTETVQENLDDAPRTRDTMLELWNSYSSASTSPEQKVVLLSELKLIASEHPDLLQLLNNLPPE